MGLTLSAAIFLLPATFNISILFLDIHSVNCFDVGFTIICFPLFIAALIVNAEPLDFSSPNNTVPSESFTFFIVLLTYIAGSDSPSTNPYPSNISF